jgi:preprotein translocase subunit SecD
MRDLLPILVVLSVLLVGAFAVAVGVVWWTSAFCGPSPQEVGVVLVYRLQQEAAADRPVNMKGLVTVIDRRLNRGWSKIARVRQLNDQQIEIGVLGNDPQRVRKIERLLARPGTLELRILANQHDHKALIERAQADTAAVLKDPQGNVQAWWVEVHEGTTLQNQEYLGAMPSAEIARRTRTQGQRQIEEVLVVDDAYDVTDRYLQSAAPDRDEFGQPCVRLELNTAGARQLGALSSENLPDPLEGFTRQLGVIVDGRLYSPQVIDAPISREVKITGSLTRQQVDVLVDVLSSGSLPAPISQVEKRTVDENQ